MSVEASLLLHVRGGSLEKDALVSMGPMEKEKAMRMERYWELPPARTRWSYAGWRQLLAGIRF